MAHTITLNHVTVTNEHGHELFMFDSIEKYEQWFDVTEKTVMYDYTDNLYAYYNVNIDNYGSYELTYSQLYDAQPIELESGRELQLFDDYELQ